MRSSHIPFPAAPDAEMGGYAAQVEGLPRGSQENAAGNAREGAGMQGSPQR
jgi:hypothetical protein